MADKLQRSPIVSGLTLSLCGDDGIEFQGQRFVPDKTKGYFQFTLSYAFPVTIVYGVGIHPNVIAKSYQSLLQQNVNKDHSVALYHEGKDVRDQFIGSVVAVDFPQGPMGGWTVNADSTKAPFVSGVASVWKQASGVARMFGDHSTNRTTYTVSMEVFWPLEEAGFAIELNGAPPEFGNSTPRDMAAAGFDYVPYVDAPKALKATWAEKRNPPMIISRYKGKKVSILSGGLDNPVHYAGMAVVRFGAERPAKIMRLAASGSGEYCSMLDKLQSNLKA